ncbi:hypothetical protein [Pseudomonas sp. KU43P]|uniref:hypothetical protein n=1 Tax=Pseudomonas sp. KU43P TaxID=2487887 RepID=UPI0012A9A0AC|nr:hypothetical protein [Pseudomonas sp. KU43P]BBH45252.1 hypothetical protein KU43P_17290 [Pseudomonas sp. KU43P]
MKLLRSVALIVCLALLCLPAGMAQAAQPAAQEQGKVARHPAKSPAKQPAKPVKKKAKPVSKAVRQPLPKARLDLSLPVDMVNELEPNVGNSTTRRKPLLPAMFTEKPQTDDSPFQLNGRLISNEMQLQLRNDSRRDVEGAAIEFEFRQ